METKPTPLCTDGDPHRYDEKGDCTGPDCFDQIEHVHKWEEAGLCDGTDTRMEFTCELEDCSAFKDCDGVVTEFTN